jgi:hypothetical protein
MAIFRVTTKAATLIVRAACLTCARRIAAERSPADEFQAWSNARVELIRDPEAEGYLSAGPSDIIERVVN